MDLSKTIAFTAILFIVVLILTSGSSVSADRSREAAKKPSEATFERSRTNQAARPAGTEYAPAKRPRRQTTEASPCQYKRVMTEADVQACRRK